jgi:signal transduction histidine kinase
VWGTDLFREVTLSIILFYVTTVMLFVGGFYYVTGILHVNNIIFVILTILLLSILVAIVIAKLSIEPLKDHFNKLEHFSKETLHELNLPISTINANTKMLRKTLSDDKSLKRLERIEKASQMLHERYSELDYLIKKQMQKEQIETFDLKELLIQRLELLQSLYAHVQFQTDLHSISLKLDRIGLQKVMDNLIDNAIKYSTAPIVVNIVLKDGVLSIIDKGVGMDELALVKIFDRYYQGDDEASGFGIGLALVKNYCDRYKIKLHVNSKPNIGTTMTLDFQGVKE